MHDQDGKASTRTLLSAGGVPTAVEYKQALALLTFGKTLPTAKYVIRDPGVVLPPLLQRIVDQIAVTLEIGPEFNLLKFHTALPKISFLSYPGFQSDPHPALADGIAVDLASGRASRQHYGDRPNPPILHRKETFLPDDHPDVPRFRRLTVQEEEVGLYEDTRTIGFRMNWQKLLQARGLDYDGHELVRIGGSRPEKSSELISQARSAKIFDRHLTALQRYDLSKPVKTLLEWAMLPAGTLVFDYGCGLGGDVAGLTAMGFDATGWDPVYRKDGEKRDADVVNLGYVLNVIEDPAERVEALHEAWGLTKRLLVVSSMVEGQDNYRFVRQFGDGVVTMRNTFQKYFEQNELQELIEAALECDAVAVSLGIFYVFRDPAAQQDFLSRRSRRKIDWVSLSRRLGFVRPPRDRRRIREKLYEEHRELFDAFWAVMLDLGRLPEDEEFDRMDELREVIRSPKVALRLFVERFGDSTLEVARQRRADDLLVYLALAQFRKRVPLKHLSARLQADIKTFFGNYQRATEKARDLLFASGDPGELENALEDLDFGWVDAEEGHFTIHRSLLDELPAVFRVYIGCAAQRYGDPREADLIKIHLHSGKLTFQHYKGFDTEALPELETRIKVDLRRFFVNVIDHTSGSIHQILFFKERFLPREYPGRDRMERFSKRLRKLGINEAMLGSNDSGAPSKEAWEAALSNLGLTRGLTKRSASTSL